MPKKSYVSHPTVDYRSFDVVESIFRLYKYAKVGILEIVYIYRGGNNRQTSDRLRMQKGGISSTILNEKKMKLPKRTN